MQLVTPLEDAFLSERLYDDLEQWVPRLVRRTVRAGHWVPRTRPGLLASWIAEFATAAGAGRPAPAGRGPYAARFAGRLVLVTGAAAGIGRATALAFAEAGARVIAVDRNGEGAARTAELARRAGAPEARAEVVDVGDERAMEKLAERVAATDGVVDVLVNNAGIGFAGAFLDTTAEDWRRVLDVNLWGVLHGCRLFGRQMAERGEGGHLVNVASAAAYLPSRALSAYGTSKAAVLMLSECLRAELAGRGSACPPSAPGSCTRTSPPPPASPAPTPGRSSGGGTGPGGCTDCGDIRRRRSPPRCCARWRRTGHSFPSPPRRASAGCSPGWLRACCGRWRAWSRGCDTPSDVGRMALKDEPTVAN